MNKDQAMALDAKYPLLPGGQGEHDFHANKTKKQIYEILDNFAENCGGMAIWGGNIELHCSTGQWLLHFDSDRLSKITKRGNLYWDASKARVLGYSYQEGNANQPDLTTDPDDVECKWDGYFYKTGKLSRTAYDRLLESHPDHFYSIVRHGFAVIVDTYAIPGGIDRIFDAAHDDPMRRRWQEGREFQEIKPEILADYQEKYAKPIPTYAALEAAYQKGEAEMVMDEINHREFVWNGRQYNCGWSSAKLGDGVVGWFVYPSIYCAPKA